MSKLKIEDFVVGFRYELDMEFIAELVEDYSYDGPKWVDRVVNDMTDLDIMEHKLKFNLVRAKSNGKGSNNKKTRRITKVS